MKRILLLTLCIITLNDVVDAKSTKIPKYTSAISILEANDSIFVENNKAELVASSNSKMFNVAVVHEVLTMKRIKSIKANETVATLSAIAMGLNSISTLSPDRVTRIRGRIGLYTSASLADIYAYNALQESKLGLEVVIENTYMEELLINDVERGLTWFIKPGANLSIPIANPDIIQLRISDLNNHNIYYIQAGGGSELKTINIDWEDDNYWAFPILLANNGYNETVGYMLISKATGERREITKDELKNLKKESKLH